jgi:hypothetical protein
MAAACGWLLYSLVTVIVPLADARLHAAAPETFAHIEGDSGSSCSPAHGFDDCILCRVQSSSALAPGDACATVAVLPPFGRVAAATSSTHFSHTNVLPLGSRAPPLS